MSADARPRVTVAIPLHRSAPFVDIVSANIERIHGDTEILVSDHTLLDDAIDRVRERHGDDPRVVFDARALDHGWVDHYNALLRMARGQYFMWMPHDDDFPADYVPLLADALDGAPRAILACGSVRAIDLDGRPRPDLEHAGPTPRPRDRHPRFVEALRLRTSWNLAIPFRGLMRRDEVLRRRLWIRHKLGDEGADASWVFALLSCAPIVFEPRCTSLKRYHPTSAHAAWHRPHLLVRLAAIPVVLRYLVATHLPPRR